MRFAWVPFFASIVACGSFGTTTIATEDSGTVDAGIDATSSGPCAKKVFEDHFDRDDIKGSWDVFEPPSAQTLRLSSAPGRTNNGLLVDIADDTSFRRGYLDERLPLDESGCRAISLSLQVRDYPAKDAVVFASFENDTKGALLVSVNSANRIEVAEQGSDPNAYRVVTELAGKIAEWHDVTVVLRGPNVTLIVDREKGDGARALGAPRAASVRIGAPSAKLHAASYRIDDVFVYSGAQ